MSLKFDFLRGIHFWPLYTIKLKSTAKDVSHMWMRLTYIFLLKFQLHDPKHLY